MKRAICFFFTFVLALFCNNMSAFATDINLELDTITLSNEEKEALGILKVYSDENTKPELRTNENIVSAIRIYNVSLLSAFTKYSSIDEVISNNCVKQTYFVLENKDGNYSYFDENYEMLKSNRYKEVDGKEVSLPPIEVSTQAISALKSSDFLKYNVDEDIKTYNVYYLCDEVNMMGSAIYYKTNYGDYVYFCHYDTGELLFTIEEFIQFEKTVLDEFSKNSDVDGANSLNSITDLSRYKISQSFIKSSNNSIEASNHANIKTIISCLILVISLLSFILILKAGNIKNYKSIRLYGHNSPKHLLKK